jgi:hypothetical protein
VKIVVSYHDRFMVTHDSKGIKARGMQNFLWRVSTKPAYPGPRVFRGHFLVEIIPILVEVAQDIWHGLLSTRATDLRKPKFILLWALYVMISIAEEG